MQKAIHRRIIFLITASVILTYANFIVPKLEFGKHKLLASNVTNHLLFDNNWKLKDTADKDIYLSKYKNKIVFIEFWFTSCRPCIEKMPTIKQLKDEFIGDERIIFISIINGQIDSFENFKHSSSSYLNNFSLYLYAPKKNMEILTKEIGINSYPFEIIFLNGKLESAHLGFSTAESPYYLTKTKHFIKQLLQKLNE